MRTMYASHSSPHEPPQSTPDLPSRSLVVSACTYAFVVWAVATVALIAVGELIIPTADTPAAAIVYVVTAIGAATAGWATGRLFIRRQRGRLAPLAAGTLLGCAIAVVGLTLDTVLVGSLGLGYPTVSDSRADTIVVGLLVGHAAALLGGIIAGWHAKTNSERSPDAP